MTKLRQEFIARLELKGFSQRTIQSYVDCVSRYSRHFKESPLKLGNAHAREFLLHLRNERKLEPKTINLHLYGIKAFYRDFFPGQNILHDFRRMKEPLKRPEVLSREEVEALISSSSNLKMKAITAVLYSSGIRLAECAMLKIRNVDSSRMVLRTALL